MLMLDVPRLCKEVAERDVFRPVGKLQSATGLLWSCALPAAVGDQCNVITGRGPVRAEVVGFARGVSYVVPYESVSEVRAGMQVVRRESGLKVPVGDSLLGRVLDGLGRPMDEAGPLSDCALRPVHLEPPAPLQRVRISKPFVSGQRAIDGLLTFGWG